MLRGGFSFLSWSLGFFWGGGLDQVEEMVEVSRVPMSFLVVRVSGRREGE